MIRSNPHRPTAWLLSALLAGTVALPAPGQSFHETTEVVAVEIPVQVLRDGEPVRGLTAANFELYDGRKRQDLTGVDVIDLSSQELAAPEKLPVNDLPAAARRHFLLLFDLTFSEPSSVVKAREAARQLVASHLHPTDLIGVAVYTLVHGPRLVLNFTSDRRQVELALETLGLPKLLDRNPDPLGLVLDRATEDFEHTQQGRGGARADRSTAILEQIRDLSLYQNQVQRSIDKGRIDAFSRGLGDLGKLMSSVPGQKYVVYLSEGFDASVLLGTTDTKRIEDMNLAAMTGEYWNVDSEERYGSSKSVNSVETMIDQFRRAGCTIESVDIGGLRAVSDVQSQGQGAATDINRATGGQDSMYIMAAGTGGELYRNFNDLGEAMGKMLDRTSVTYVLSFEPQKLKTDGSFHRVKVKLKDVPGDVRIIARPGYYAPKPLAERTGVEQQLTTAALILGGGAAGAVDTSLFAAPFQFTPGDKSYVPVLVEIGGDSLVAGAAGGSVPAEIFVYAFDDRGGVSDFFTQKLTLDLAKVGPALHHSGLKLFGELRLPPGRYQVRVLVRCPETGLWGLRTADVQVPGPAATEATLLPPLFPEQPGKWLIVRGPQEKGAAQPPYPFMLNDEPFIPAVRPQLRPGEATRMVLTGYNLHPEKARLEAELRGADGQPVAGAKISAVHPAATAKGRPGGLVASFEASGVKPGDYTLKVALLDPGSGAREESSIPVRVVQ